MGYKNKDKQREAVREATRRYRARKGITKGVILAAPVVIPKGKPKPQSYNPMMVGYVPPTGQVCKASGRPLDGLTVGKCSQAGLKASQGQGGAKKGITPQGGGGVDINSTPLNMS